MLAEKSFQLSSADSDGPRLSFKPLKRSMAFSIRLRSYRPPGNVGPGYLPSRLALSNAVGDKPARAATSRRDRPRGITEHRVAKRPREHRPTLSGNAP